MYRTSTPQFAAHPLADPAGSVQRAWSDFSALQRGSAESERQAREAEARLDRLAADAKLVEVLKVSGYSGAAWERFTRALAEYGVAVFRKWISTGQVFAKCATKGHGKLPVRPRTPEDAVELALETVGTAINYFRQRVLIPGKWDPTRGASIKTFFIGACVITFPNVYRRWCHEQRQLPRLVASDDNVLVHTVDERPSANLFMQVASREAAASVEDPTMRRILEMNAHDYTHAEIAEAIGQGITAKSVETRLYRFKYGQK